MFCKGQKPLAKYRAAFTRQRSLVGTSSAASQKSQTHAPRDFRAARHQTLKAVKEYQEAQREQTAHFIAQLAQEGIKFDL